MFLSIDNRLDILDFRILLALVDMGRTDSTHVNINLSWTDQVNDHFRMGFTQLVELFRQSLYHLALILGIWGFDCLKEGIDIFLFWHDVESLFTFCLDMKEVSAQILVWQHLEILDLELHLFLKIREVNLLITNQFILMKTDYGDFLISEIVIWLFQAKATTCIIELLNLKAFLAESVLDSVLAHSWYFVVFFQRGSLRKNN